MCMYEGVQNAMRYCLYVRVCMANVDAVNPTSRHAEARGTLPRRRSQSAAPPSSLSPSSEQRLQRSGCSKGPVRPSRQCTGMHLRSHARTHARRKCRISEQRADTASHCRRASTTSVRITPTPVRNVQGLSPLCKRSRLTKLDLCQCEQR